MYVKYSIKKSTGFGNRYNEIAKVWINNDCQLCYKMLIPDKDVESVILKAQKDKGLYVTMPYSKSEGKLHIEAQKKHFIPINDEQIFNAIETNLKNGLVSAHE